MTFGCEICSPTDPEAAWAARKGLTRTQELVDESHFIVAVLTCPACGQARVSVFVEEIDWAGGDDPQHWTLLPVTAAEVVELTQLDQNGLCHRLAELGAGRVCLHRDFPKDGPIRVTWGNGVVLP